MTRLAVIIFWRGVTHDVSKLSPMELRGFMGSIGALSKSKYGTQEYVDQLRAGALAESIAHHYATNRHHPEYHGGIYKMDLIDLVEMIADWAAAADGSLAESLNANRQRFWLDSKYDNLLRTTATNHFRKDM